MAGSRPAAAVRRQRALGRGALGRGALGRGALGRGALGRGALGRRVLLARELLAVVLVAAVVELLLRTATLERTTRLLGVRLDLTGRTAGAEQPAGGGPIATSDTGEPTPRDADLDGGPPTAEPAGADPAAERPLPARARRALLATDAVLRRWPFGDTCLRRCLVLGRRLRGLSPALRLGAARDGAGYRVHAWLVVRGRSIDPTAPEFSTLVAA